jgi:hypothetical protein
MGGRFVGNRIRHMRSDGGICIVCFDGDRERTTLESIEGLVLLLAYDESKESTELQSLLQ